ncbi:MAG: hypothetical protein IZT57_00745 [Chloroflexi bacterium]|nr:hypothetical protein [Chloroflexota bacterium]
MIVTRLVQSLISKAVKRAFPIVGGGGSYPLTFEATNEGILESDDLVFNNANETYGYAWTYPMNSGITLYEIDYSAYGATRSVGARMGMNNGGDPENGGTSLGRVDYIFEYNSNNGVVIVNDPASNPNDAVSYPNDLPTIDPYKGGNLIGFVVNMDAKTVKVYLDNVYKGVIDITAATDPRVYVNSGESGWTGKIQLRVNESKDPTYTYDGLITVPPKSFAWDYDGWVTGTINKNGALDWLAYNVDRDGQAVDFNDIGGKLWSVVIDGNAPVEHVISYTGDSGAFGIIGWGIVNEVITTDIVITEVV